MNYARTRVALLTLALARIAELDAADGVRYVPDFPVSPSGLAVGLASVLHQMITDVVARRRVLARFELAFEATRRPELRAAYDQLGLDFRTQAVRLLAAAGSAEPPRDAWTLIAWMEGTAFYALAGAGAGAFAAPTPEMLRTSSRGSSPACAEMNPTRPARCPDR